MKMIPSYLIILMNDEGGTNTMLLIQYDDTICSHYYHDTTLSYRTGWIHHSSFMDQTGDRTVWWRLIGTIGKCQLIRSRIIIITDQPLKHAVWATLPWRGLVE